METVKDRGLMHPFRFPPWPQQLFHRRLTYSHKLFTCSRTKRRKRRKTKEDDVEECNTDEDSMPIGDLVKGHLTRHDNKSYISDHV